MTNYEALVNAKQACVDTKRAITRLDELNELMARGDFEAAVRLMAELKAK